MKLRLASVRGQYTYNDGWPLLRCKIVSVKKKTYQNRAENLMFSHAHGDKDAIGRGETVHTRFTSPSESAEKLLG